MSAGRQYSSGAIVLHWVIAFLIIGQIAGGWFMHQLPNESPAKFPLFQVHKSLGLAILMLTVARIFWRFTHRTPPLPTEMSKAGKLIARLTHGIFYALLILTPVIGWTVVSASPTGIPTLFFGIIPWPHLPFIGDLSNPGQVAESLAARHKFLALSIGALLVLHIGAALKHHFIARDGVLTSILPSRRAHFLFIAAGLGPLVVAAFLYYQSGFLVPSHADKPIAPNQQANLSAAQSQTTDDKDIFWAIDKSTSALTFTGTEKGQAFTGTFASFDIRVSLDPSNITQATIEVIVDTSSAMTNDNTRDSNLPTKPWFNISDFPMAIFRSTDIVKIDATSFEARGTLTIKDVSIALILPFELTIADDLARATGNISLLRTDYNLGTDNYWLDDEEVGLDVGVSFEVNASR